MKKLILFLCCLTIGIAGFAGQSQAVPTGLELLLLVDVSGSVSSSEYNTQKGGYVSAFQNAGIQSAIANITGGIAVAYAEWSSSNQQSLQVSWTHLTDAASSNAFASAIDGVTRAFSGGTQPSYAINWGNPLFDNNGFESTRLVMDVSGDGTGSSSLTQAARDAAFADGIAINGLAIGGTTIENWYAANIVTSNGFLVGASTFADFEQAVLTKIGREIKPPEVPEPGTVMLLVLGLLGLAGLRRRTR